jgi:hypothetical protein
MLADEIVGTGILDGNRTAVSAMRSAVVSEFHTHGCSESDQDTIHQRYARPRCSEVLVFMH